MTRQDVPPESGHHSSRSVRERISFRRLTRDDYGLLAQWLAEPHVSRWWGPTRPLDQLEADYGPGIDGTDPTQVFVVEADGASIGMIQRYMNRDDPGWDAQVRIPGAAGIDYYIGDPAYVGRGIGTAMISSFVATVFVAYSQAACITAGVLRDNLPSWRALEKVGFRREREFDLESSDPWDRGPGFLYVLARPEEST
jgi:RimJ/RimL family protein N-acetyltransferase